ncbi:hypothetical protein NIES2101_26715 [Calothrix sp. HK-06]|nr:hypothetical protein NIES2101_26715 [Calothrix sp. HK-06]
MLNLAKKKSDNPTQSVTKKAKVQPMRLLSYGQATSIPVAISSLVSATAASLCFLIMLANYGATSSIARYTQGMSLIQLQDGSTAVGSFANPNERSNEVIKNFVANSMIKIFTWNGLIRSEENGRIIETIDKGTPIKSDNAGKKLIPTSVWKATFALSEEKDFRASFLQKLAETIPDGILNGKGTVTLITNHLSAPRKLEDGKWEVDMVANLVTFDAERSQSRGVEFNKTVTVRAIDVPQNLPKINDITQDIYKAKAQGLEIVQIVDLDLGRKKK